MKTTVEAHYDGVGVVDEAERRQGVAYPLKRFHNEQKKRLLSAFLTRGCSVLDVACGRGGDMWKYANAGVAHVTGIDVSSNELSEAERRADLAGVSFVAVKHDARQPFDLDRTFDVVSCMFALHYFFESEDTASIMLANVSKHLAVGGTFVGIVPDGRCVCPMHNSVCKIRVLDDEPRCFGSAYEMSIEDTVTQCSEGVREYLVFSNVLVALAAKHGLYPLNLPWLSRIGGRALWHFDPPYGGDLKKCTDVYAAFAFRKVA